MNARTEAERREITRQVERWSRGEDGAFDHLIELVYSDLKAIAHRHLALSARDGDLDTTVLVHEAWVRLAGVDEGEWEGRAQFFAFCSTVMRRILIDFARRRTAEKRGGTRMRVPLGNDTPALEHAIEDVLAVEKALVRLEERNPRMARIAECRFYGGLSIPETANALETSVRTVEREWARARAYLHDALADET